MLCAAQRPAFVVWLSILKNKYLMMKTALITVILMLSGCSHLCTQEQQRIDRAQQCLWIKIQY